MMCDNAVDSGPIAYCTSISRIQETDNHLYLDDVSHCYEERTFEEPIIICLTPYKGFERQKGFKSMIAYRVQEWDR